MSGELIDEYVGDSNCNIFNIDTFNSEYSDLNDLLIMSFNVRSFHANGDEFVSFLNNLVKIPDIIVLTETWFSDTYCDGFDDYCAFHVCRTNRRGGGVSIFVRNRYKVELIDKLCNNIYEYCDIKIYVNNVIINIMGVYRPPSDVNIQEFTGIMERKLSLIDSTELCFVCGDLNIDLLNPNNTEQLFFDMLRSYLFTSLITQPTRIGSNSISLIDHIWSNSLSGFSSGVILNDISDHYMTFVYVPIPTNEGDITFSFRDHSDVCVEKFSIALTNYLNNRFSLYSDINFNDRFSIFCDDIYDLYNKYCPVRMKSISVKRIRRPWLGGDIIKNVNRKHKLFKLYKEGSLSFNIYNSFKNKLSRSIKTAKRNYFRFKLENNRRDLKQSWKFINMLLGKKIDKEKQIDIEDNGIITGDCYAVANIFNEYFANVGHSLDLLIDNRNINPVSYMAPSNPSSFYFCDTNTVEVSSVINSLPNKGSPLNRIPTIIFKAVSSVISPVVSNLYNCSIREGIFPDYLKIGKLTPLFKKGLHTNKKNYRPITSLNILSKIFEKLTYSRCISFLNNFNILSNKQYGFRSEKSTADALLEYTDKAYKTLDAGDSFLTVFIDFSKAFDTVNHSILLKKLHHIGFRGNSYNWFQSYLSNRKQYVTIHDSTSDYRDVTIGVPQGSTLGPLLFIIYINDLCNCLLYLDALHFADDTTLFIGGSNLRLIETMTNDDLTRLTDWLCVNRLSLNLDKTKYMLMTKRNDHSDVNIYIDDTYIDRTDNHEFLGIVIDDKLKYDRQIDKIAKKLSRSLGIMRRLATIVPVHSLRSLYFSLFYPHQIYAIIIWGSACQTLLNRIGRLNARAVNLLNCLGDQGVCENSGVFDFKQCYIYFVILKIYDIIKNNNHEHFANLVQEQQPNHDHSTRFASNGNLVPPLYTNSRTQRSFFYRAITHWNSLPPNFRIITSRCSFKGVLKKYLVSL